MIAHQVAYQLALAEQPNCRNLQPFLENLGHAEGHRAGSEPAHVHVVGLIGGYGDKLALVEDRRDEREVVQVPRPGGIGRI